MKAIEALELTEETLKNNKLVIESAISSIIPKINYHIKDQAENGYKSLHINIQALISTNKHLAEFKNPLLGHMSFVRLVQKQLVKLYEADGYTIWIGDSGGENREMITIKWSSAREKSYGRR